MSRPAPEWMRRYEALRAHAIGEALLDLVPLGLVLLWHRGVAAWMAAECSATDASTAAERVGRARADVLGPRRSELVRLLAASALLIARERAS